MSALAAFAMNVVIARIFGAAEAGIFFLSVTIVLAASVVSRFGMDNTLIRFVSPAWEQGDYSRALGVSLQGFGIVAVIGAVVTAFLYLTAENLAIYAFNEPALTSTLKLMAFSIIPFSLLWVLSGTLKAVKLPARANFIEAGVIPLVFCSVVFLIISTNSGANLDTVAAVYLLATFIGAGIGLFFFFRRLDCASNTVTIPVTELANSASTLMWVAILNFIVMWSSSIFLGVYADAEAVGLYNVAHRTAALISFVLIVFNSVTSPRFASLYHEGRLDELEKLAVRTAITMTVAAAPVLISMTMFPEWVLSIFGDEYKPASILLLIIAIGQFINVITGSVGYLLIMSGNGHLMRNTMVFTACLAIFLNVILVERYGAIGAAITTTVSLASQNLLAAWFVYKKMGIRTIPGWRYVNRLRFV